MNVEIINDNYGIVCRSMSISVLPSFCERHRAGDGGQFRNADIYKSKQI
jgi:hypothetical protein